MVNEWGFFGHDRDPDLDCGTAAIIDTRSEKILVPIMDVEKSFYTASSDDVPEEADYMRIFYYEGDPRLRADAWLPDGRLLLMTQVQGDSQKFTAEVFEEPPSTTGEEAEIWRSPLKSEYEFSMLVGQLSPAEAIDYWAVRMSGAPMAGWAESRGVSPQAVSENVRKAHQKLQQE